MFYVWGMGAQSSFKLHQFVWGMERGAGWGGLVHRFAGRDGEAGTSMGLAQSVIPISGKSGVCTGQANPHQRHGARLGARLFKGTNDMKKGAGTARQIDGSRNQGRNRRGAVRGTAKS